MRETDQSTAVLSSDPPVLVRVITLGLTPYPEALAEQRRLHQARALDEIPDTLLLLEHPHVYTLGRNSDPGHILVDEKYLGSRGATVERIERGGEVTYHGPGQLVAYPIIKLHPAERSITLLVWRLEEAIIRTLAAWQITARRDEAGRGVWVGERKIASIGMSLRRWVVLHGMALNAHPDLSYFDHINPCGQPGLRVTSMERELGTPVTVEAVGREFRRQFGAVFARTEMHS